jgi:hypothetical protein
LGRRDRHLLARSVMFGKALRAVYAVGYTGLGVAASRFGAQVALDLADGRDTERTRAAHAGPARVGLRQLNGVRSRAAR